MKGLAFPIRLSGSGGLKMTEGTNHLKETLELKLNTRLGERTMNPQMGNTLDITIFDNDSSTLSLFRYELKKLLDEEGLNVKDTDINIIQGEETLLVQVNIDGDILKLNIY